MQELEQIRIGQHADDGTGEALRDGMGKVNDNFAKVKQGVEAVESTAASAAEVAAEAKAKADGDIPAAAKGMAGGVAPLDDRGKVPAAHLPTLTDYLPADEKGAPGGVAPLDEQGKVPAANLPATADAIPLSQKGAAEGVAPLGADSKVPVVNLPAGMAGGVAPLDALGKVPAANLPPQSLDDVDFAVIYPVDDPTYLPVIYANTRLIVDNPFPGYALLVVVEIYSGDEWGDPGWFTAYLPNSGDDYRGVRAHHLLESDKIVVQAGENGTQYPGYLSGGALGDDIQAETSAAFRLKVWKIKKVGDL